VKVCTLTSDGKVAVVDRPEPRAAGKIVKVQVEITPMCTEFKDRRAGATADVLGHEAAGVVVDSAGSELVSRGDRVVVMPGNACGMCRACSLGEHIYCRHQRDVLAETGSAYGTATYAEYLIKPDWLLLPVPAGISLNHAALACCGLGPGLNAMLRLRVTKADTVLVSGCGPVGLGAIVHSVARGATVIAIEPNKFRARLAVQLGAVATVSPGHPDFRQVIDELTDGSGASCAIETSGILSAPRHVLSALRPLGRMALLAWDAQVELPPLVQHGLEVYACWHWNHIRDAAAMWATIRQFPRALDAMVTHEFELESAAQAMDVQDTGRCGKVLLHVGADRAAA
jgi:threonine dehydrogenase-like Zn-dependent dehydrogenase